MGPWRAQDNDIFFHGKGRRELIGSVSMERPNWQDHARLIAAAPDLLEALKVAAAIIGHPDDAMSKHIRETIAKAEEEQP